MTEQHRKTVVNTASHDVSLDDGRTLRPGQQAENVNVNSAHNAALVDDGHLNFVSIPTSGGGGGGTAGAVGGHSGGGGGGTAGAVGGHSGGGGGGTSGGKGGK